MTLDLLHLIATLTGTAGPASLSSVCSACRGRPDAITIASFNIQVFATSKLEKPQVTDVQAQIVRCPRRTIRIDLRNRR